MTIVDILILAATAFLLIWLATMKKINDNVKNISIISNIIVVIALILHYTGIYIIRDWLLLIIWIAFIALIIRTVLLFKK